MVYHDITESYCCESCGTEGIVSHNCDTMRFCPVCGESVPESDVEKIDQEDDERDDE